MIKDEVFEYVEQCTNDEILEIMDVYILNLQARMQKENLKVLAGECSSIDILICQLRRLFISTPMSELKENMQ